MKRSSRIERSQLFSAIILIAVVGSLCFSVGEGLRLTPFPVSALTHETTDSQRAVRASQGTYLQNYGPLDVPTQNQKRSKRQTVDFACPPSGNAHRVSSQRYPRFEEALDRVASNLFVSRPLGRAPPVINS